MKSKKDVLKRMDDLIDDGDSTCMINESTRMYVRAIAEGIRFQVERGL